MTKQTIEMTNKQAVQFYLIVSNVSAQGRKSRALIKFNKRIWPKVEEYQNDKTEINKRFFVKDEQGEFVRDQESNEVIWLPDVDKAEHEKLISELDEEIAVVDLTEYMPFLEFLISGLNEWDYPLIGSDAVVYDELMDKLEDLQETVKGDK